MPFAADRGERLVQQARAAGNLDRMHAGLVSAVGGVGGPAAVRRLGPTTANRIFQTHLAWVLRVPLDHVERAPGPASIFVARGPGAGPPATPKWRRPGAMRSALTLPDWRVVVAWQPSQASRAALSLQPGKPRRESAEWPLRIR